MMEVNLSILTNYNRTNWCDLDTARLTWTSEIVSAFKPPPPSPPPDGFLKDYFEREIETMSDFHSKHRGKPGDHMAREIRRILLSNLNNTHVGTYSKFHDNSTYHLGYNHPTTIRLAYMYKSPFLPCYFDLFLIN